MICWHSATSNLATFLQFKVVVVAILKCPTPDLPCKELFAMSPSKSGLVFCSSLCAPFAVTTRKVCTHTSQQQNLIIAEYVPENYR